MRAELIQTGDVTASPSSPSSAFAESCLLVDGAGCLFRSKGVRHVARVTGRVG